MAYLLTGKKEDYTPEQIQAVIDYAANNANPDAKTAQAIANNTKAQPAAPAYAPQRSSLKGAAELANLYGGITYDENTIRSKFDTATAAEYNKLRNEYDTTANKFYGQMYGTQNTALDTIRKSNAAAVANGASRGIQAANELSAILGLEQTNSQTATQLAADRNLLMDKEAAAYTKNVVDALTTSNSVKQALANLGANIYASDTQFDVGEMNYYAALNQAAKALEGTKYTADSNLTGTKYTADQNLSGVKYNADQNLSGTKYNADKNLEGNKYTSDNNLSGTKYTADQNLAGTKYNADQNLAGNKYTADQNLSGTKYNADQNLAGTKYNADQNLKGAQATAAATVQAAVESGKATVTAAEVSNAAMKSYYDFMKTQATNSDGTTDYEKGMNFLQKQYDGFMAKKDYESAAIWYSKLTGLDYDKALDRIKNSSIVKADLAVVAKNTQSSTMVNNIAIPRPPAEILTIQNPPNGTVKTDNAGNAWVYYYGYWTKR